MKRIIIPILFAICFLAQNMRAQELNFTVTVNTKQVSGTDQRIYEALQEGMMNFMNNRIWTNIKFEQQERIEGTMVLVVKSREGNVITGELSVGVRRPVYKSNYNTPILNIIDDDFSINYIESQPLDFNENSFMSNLTSILAFYGYFTLGIYFDTFGLEGGENFFKAAEMVVTAAQSAVEPGWKAFDSYKNRYWLLESFQNKAYRPLRKYMYEYHRLGLDVMGNGKVDDGRTAISKSLDYVKEVYSSKPNLYFLQILNDTKREEWKGIYSDGPQQEKTKAVNILREIDAPHAEEYEELLNAKPRF
ncbi:MAG: DUF4835 family protein [Bacteroidales bacterium]|nr:DUF4835 family protein [Bacteroidales bacterium]